MTGQLGRLLLGIGALLVVVGGVLLLAERLGLGRLPGDLVFGGENWRVYIPLGWMVLLSILLTVLLNLFLRR